MASTGSRFSDVGCSLCYNYYFSPIIRYFFLFYCLLPPQRGPSLITPFQFAIDAFHYFTIFNGFDCTNILCRRHTSYFRVCHRNINPQAYANKGDRGKRGVLHLYNMIFCATGCEPLAYKGYGCYCGFLGAGRPTDGIDRFVLNSPTYRWY